MKEKLIECWQSERKHCLWSDNAYVIKPVNPKDLGHLLPAWKKWKKLKML